MLSNARLALVLVLMLGMALPALAQGDEDEACPALVAEALALVDESCAGLGRNQACYGHTRVEATGWDEAPVGFAESGDRAEVLALASLVTFPLDVESSEWGVAVLALQADLAGTLPGQAVTFVVFGDAELVSEVAPGDVAAPPPTCEAANTGSGNLNIRSGPGTGFAAVGALVAGESVTANGRNAAGDWLRFDRDGESGWVYAPLITVDCDPAVLDVVEDDAPGAGYTAPMQAFSLTTGFGEPPCAEAPRDGLLVQAPQDVTVHFRINGVEVAVGSTGLLALEEGGAVQVNTLDGAIDVTSAGQTQRAEPGYRVSAESGVPPSEPEPYPYEEVQAAPVNLLPEPVNVPVTVPSQTSWIDTGLMVQAGQAFTISVSGTSNICSDCFDAERASFNVWVGPDGNAGMPICEGQWGDCPLMPGLYAALIGRIGDGDAFLVGTGGSFVADRDGPFQLGFNDHRYDDNTGAYIAVITIDQ